MKTFLIADSSQIVLEALEFALEQHGFQVFKAENEQQIKQLYQTQNIDFAIINSNINKIDGISLAGELLKIKPCKILIMSDSQNYMLKQRAKKLGITGWILKPFIPNHLIKSIIKTFG